MTDGSGDFGRISAGVVSSEGRLESSVDDALMKECEGGTRISPAGSNGVSEGVAPAGEV